MMPTPTRRSISKMPAVLLCALLAGCGGLGHRSVEQVEGSVAVGAEIRRVRVIVENGTVEVSPPDDASVTNVVTYKGGLRRAADTAEDLAKIEALPAAMTAAPDPEDPTTLVITAPHLPEGVVGVVACEVNVRLPAGMPLELIIRNNGHIVLDHRMAPSDVRTGRGNLRCMFCEGAVTGRTGAGFVIVHDHRGDLDLRTAAGDMQVFLEEAGETLTLDSGKGTVQCRVPNDLEFEVDARVEKGRIGNDFDLEVRQIGDFGAAMVGRRGAASTTVILRTAGGHIQFKKAKKAAKNG